MLPKRLENLRENKDWNKSKVAKELKIPRSTYATYENGIHEPDNKMLIRIANLYKVSVDYLVGNDYVNEEYSLPEHISTFHEAIEFLQNILITTKDMTEEDILKFAQTIFYIAKK